MDTKAFVGKLLDSKSRIPLIMQIRDDLWVVVTKFKQKKRWHLETDLHNSYSNFDYSEEGQEKLKNLATDSQLSDGVRLERQNQRIFCLSFADDSKESVKYTYGIWLEVMKGILLQKSCVVDISTMRMK